MLALDVLSIPSSTPERDAPLMSVLIVDRSQFMADTMSEILKSRPGVQIVDITTDADAALRRIDQCNTLIVSAALPGDRGLELVRAAIASNPRIKIVVMDLVGPGPAAAAYILAGATACCYEEETIGELLRKARPED